MRVREVRKSPIIAFTLFLVFSASASAQTDPLPNWLRAHMDFMTQGTGLWVADNSAFRNEGEPFEAYATEWKYGVGKMVLKGRLYGIRDGKPTGDFWEYQVFWHPAEKKAYFWQIGAGGAVGVGEMKDNSEGAASGRRTEMTLNFPDGSSITDRHDLLEEPGKHTTISYTLNEMYWKIGRRYVWKLQEK